MNEDLNETVMSPGRKNLFQRKRSEYDQIGRNNNLSFQHTLPELTKKQSIGQYTPYKSVMVDPALNFVNPTRRHMQFTKSNKLDQGNSLISIEVKEADESPDDEKSQRVLGPISFTKKLLNAESTQFSFDKPKYQLSRRTFGIGYSMSPHQFAATSSKMSLSPSLNQSKMSPSQSGVTNNNNYYGRTAKDQNLKLDAKECETETIFELHVNPTEQKLILQGLLDFYHSMVMTAVSQMTQSNSGSITEIAQLIKRIIKSMNHCSSRIKSLVGKEIELLRGQVRRAEDLKDKMGEELNDFKLNRTIEAYFSRLQKIPNLEDREKLIQMIDQYLIEEKMAQKQETYGIRDQSAGADLVLQGLEEPINVVLEVQEQSTLDAFERRMADTLKEVKTVMLTEAEAVRRLTERNIREKQALTGGRVPVKTKATETLSWGVIHNKFQSVIDDGISKLAILQETTDRQLKNANSTAEQRGKEIYSLEQKIESLEQYKKRTNLQNIQRQLSDIIYSILENRLEGGEIAEVMFKFQEAAKMIDKNQESAAGQARKNDQSIKSQAQAGLFKQKAIKNTNLRVDISEPTLSANESIASPTSSDLISAAKKPGLVPFVMPKADKPTLKVIEYNITEISTILLETDELVNLFLSQKDLCLFIEDQIDMLGDGLKIVEKLHETFTHIISACEQSRGSNIGPTTLLQILHLKNKTEQLLNSEDFKKSKRVASQFKSLPIIRQLVNEIKKVKDQEDRALKGEEEAPKVNFMSDVVQTLCHILSAKEKLTLLPNTQSIVLFIQIVVQLKEIRDVLSDLLIPEQRNFLNQVTNPVMGQKKAYEEMLSLNGQLQRLVPKTLEQDKIREDSTRIIQLAIVASEKMKNIHKLDKDLLKVVLKTQEMIKNHVNKALDFVQVHGLKAKQLNKVEEEDLEYKYDSDGGEAVLVLAVPDQKKQQVLVAPVPQKISNKVDQSKSVQKSTAPNQIKVQTFTQEELNQIVAKECKRKVQEAIAELKKNHEIDKKGLMEKLQLAVSSQMHTKQTENADQGNINLKPPGSRAENRSNSKNSRRSSPSIDRGQPKEQKKRIPTPVKTNTEELVDTPLAPNEKSKNSPPLVKKSKPKPAVVSNEPKAAPKQQKQPKTTKPASPKNSVSTSTVQPTPKKVVKLSQEVKEGKPVKKEEVQPQKADPEGGQCIPLGCQIDTQKNLSVTHNYTSHTNPKPDFTKSDPEKTNITVAKHHSEILLKSIESSVEQISEDIVSRSKNSEETSHPIRIIALESTKELSIEDSQSKVLVEEEHSSHEKGVKEMKFPEHSPKSAEGQERNDQWITKDRQLNKTMKAVISEQHKQVVPIKQRNNMNTSIETLEKIVDLRKESINTPLEIEHLDQPRLAAHVPDQQNLAPNDRNIKLDVKIKPKRDFINDKPEFQPSINFKNKNRKPMVPSRAENNATPEELYTSTIYDRTSQQSYHEQVIAEPIQEEINRNLNLSFQNQMTRRDSHSTLGDKLEPKLQNGISPNRVNKDLNSDLAPVQVSPVPKKLYVATKHPILMTKSSYSVTQVVQNEMSQTQGEDTLGEFLNLVSSAFDQLMSSMPKDPKTQQSILNRVSVFTESLININKDYNKNLNQPIYNEIKAQEETIQDNSPSKKAASRSPPSFNKFEQAGTYQLEMNKHKKQRVTVKNVGRIGGGFMGHTAK